MPERESSPLMCSGMFGIARLGKCCSARTNRGRFILTAYSCPERKLIAPALLEHGGVLPGSVEVKCKFACFGAFKRGISHPGFEPIIEMSVIAAKKLHRKTLNRWEVLKNSMETQGATEKSAKIEHAPALQLRFNVGGYMLYKDDCKALRLYLTALELLS